MNKQELKRALSHIHASGDLKKEVLAMKSKSKTDVRQLAKRAAVCAAVLALLIGIAILLERSDEKAPFLTVTVYADDNQGVELQLPDQDSAISNVTKDGPYSSGPAYSVIENGGFVFQVRLNEFEKQYASKRVYQDGKELERLNTKDLRVADLFVFTKIENESEYQFTTSVETLVEGYTEEATEIEIHYLKEGGELLLKCVISITPQEEGFLIILQEVYVAES